MLSVAAGILLMKPAVFISSRIENLSEKLRDERLHSLGVVSVVSGEWYGSGVVIAYEDDTLVIASAKHLLMYDVHAQVVFSVAGGRSVTGEVIGYSTSYDLAYLRVSGEEMRNAGEDPAAYEELWADRGEIVSDGPGGEHAGSGLDGIVTAQAYERLRAGDMVWQVGFFDDAVAFFQGTVQAKEVFVSDYNASMLLNECHALPGMSGGGAFDGGGRLVGVIIAGDAQGTVCMPATTVLEEYRQINTKD